MADVISKVRTRLSFLLGLASLAMLASCNKDNKPALVPVQGQVFVAKKPAHNAVVWFHPVDPVEPGQLRPRGVVAEDGSFQLGTYAPGDGVPPGKYRVTVFWKTPVKSGDEDGVSLIPVRYMNPAKSGLPEVEVQQEPLTLPAFQLTKN